MDKMYTLKQVSALLGLSDKTIQRYLEQGKIKASWFGNRWRFKPEEVKRFVDGRESKNN